MTTLVQIAPERERNGYDDSDFYISTLDLETGKIDNGHEVGSTRYSNGACRYDGIATPADLTADQRARFEGILWAHAIQIAEGSEVSRIMHPGPFFAAWTPQPGTRVTLKEAVNNRKKNLVVCRKCGGGGKWTNPKNASDKRDCFGCSGSGSQSVLGKGMRQIPAGTTGTIVNAAERRSQYGTWSYGASARIRTDDGQEFNAPTDKLRLAEEPDMRRARVAAKEFFLRATTWSCHVTGRHA